MKVRKPKLNLPAAPLIFFSTERSPMKIVLLIARLLMGLMFFVLGLNPFLET